MCVTYWITFELCTHGYSSDGLCKDAKARKDRVPCIEKEHKGMTVGSCCDETCTSSRGCTTRINACDATLQGAPISFNTELDLGQNREPELDLQEIEAERKMLADRHAYCESTRRGAFEDVGLIIHPDA